MIFSEFQKWKPTTAKTKRICKKWSNSKTAKRLYLKYCIKKYGKIDGAFRGFYGPHLETEFLRSGSIISRH